MILCPLLLFALVSSVSGFHAANVVAQPFRLQRRECASSVRLCAQGRRDCLRSVGSGILSGWIAERLRGVNAAWAAPPLTAAEADNVGARLARKFRPKPPKVLRPKLDLDFAVLLMRSSYNVLDELDTVAMDQFQRDFFLTRQAEYEPYVSQLGPGFVKQGDLTDPYYFDFISFAQYKAINREITVDPAFMFEEKQPVEMGEGEPQKFVSRVIRRDPALTNDLLPVEHSCRVGEQILARLDTVFGGSKSGLPESSGRRPNASELRAALEQLVKLFLINGFAWDGNATLVSESSDGKIQVCLTLTSPATIWGGQSLLNEKTSIRNDFLYVYTNELWEHAMPKAECSTFPDLYYLSAV
eukprot:scaffold13528_cov169-Amphora_coffeaeformis.AAC.9